MNTIDHSSVRLLTWLDIERRLKQATHLWHEMPDNITVLDCFASGLDIYYKGSEGLVDEWLAAVFGRQYKQDSRQIQLEIGRTDYPVTLLPGEGIQDAPVAGYPLWKDVVYLPSDQEDEDEHKITSQSHDATSEITVDPDKNNPEAFSSGPELISFHSFKGGVGRTSALMTYVAACFKAKTFEKERSNRKKILVVDADLEAPGISFWLDSVNTPSVSFVQLLEALHYPPASIEDSLDYFANELQKTSISVSGLDQQLFVLPAALDLREIQDMPVTPEHLARNPSNPWQLSDYLHELGKRLDVDAVFIDLRAGLSELSSPLLFDQRIDHFFVTTVAPQSVKGMAEILRRLYAYNSRLNEGAQTNARPTVVLSLLTKELRESKYYQEALKLLGSAYPTADPLEQQVQWLEADFNNSLMSIGSVGEALDSLAEARPLFPSAIDWAKALYTVQPASVSDDFSKQELATEDRQNVAKKLYDVCNKSAFAESTELGNLLAIEPLLNLGKHFAKEVPNALMIGAKGAGKTFTFRQLVQSGGWEAFLEKLSFPPNKIEDALIFPTLWSTNIEDSPTGEIKSAQQTTLQQLGVGYSDLLTASTLNRKISKALSNPPEHWDDFWDELIASQFDLPSSGLSEINTLLHNQGKRMILVFDGIEDAFKDAATEPSNKAIESLIKLPSRLSELTDPCLGAIVFVRLDYVQDVIRQNLGQLLSRYEPFRLHWNAESFLRLAYMLSCQAKLYPAPQRAESMGLEELKVELELLWGKKLGREKSKEAHSARWVYAALCDLKGNVQARDLVRFLKFASKKEQGRSGQTWSDRLLAPESMRNAISDCSKEKVDEAKVEISALRNWVDEMEAHGLRNIKVPFSAQQAGLDQKVLKTLQEIGVIYEDNDSKNGDERLYVPEIYRYGLGFETSATGRPRTQALLKKNIGAIPL